MKLNCAKHSFLTDLHTSLHTSQPSRYGVKCELEHREHRNRINAFNVHACSNPSLPLPASVPFIGNLMIERVSFQVVPLHRNNGMNVDSVCLGAIHLSTQPSAYEDLARVVGTGKWFN